MTNPAVYLIDQYVAVKPGEPYRLLPFGTVIKNGQRHEITPAYARTFKLPHFKPPIKLGSHADEAPAGGHILSLEVRDDGLYAIPEVTDKGARALDEGDYRYHSPEIIWDGGGIEHPTTGEFIHGPLIIGDALLHTPHLGEAAALYSIEPNKPREGSNTMSNAQVSDTVAVPSGLFDRLMARLFGELDENKTKPAPAPTTESTPAPEPVKPVTEAEEFKAVAKQRDDLAAQLAKLEAEQRQRETLAAITAQLQDKEKFGSAYIDLKAASEAASVLAGMSEDQRNWVMRNFSALAAQIKETALTTEIGSAAEGANHEADPGKAFVAAVEARMKADHLSFVAAYELVKVEQADLFKAYLSAK